MTNENKPIMTCYKHPNRETLLRCNQCDQPICMECAVATPTGYRCKSCIQQQQKRFSTAIPRDYALSAVTAFGLSAVGAWLLMNYIPFPLWGALLLGLGMGNGIPPIIRFLTKKRRAPQLTKTVLISAGIGGLFPLRIHVVSLLAAIFIGDYHLLVWMTTEAIWVIFYVGVTCSAISMNMRGFALRRKS